METKDTTQDRVRARDAAMRLLNRLTTGAAIGAVVGVGLLGAISACRVPENLIAHRVMIRPRLRPPSGSDSTSTRERCACLVGLSSTSAPRPKPWRPTRGAGVLVSLGGDIAVAGEAPPEGWPVQASEDSSAPLDDEEETVTITSGGIATSSTTVRRWTRGGVVLHHIMGHKTLAWLEANRLPARLVDHEGKVRRVAGWPEPAGNSYLVLKSL